METTPTGFEEFWDIYPRRVAKVAAMKAYKRALKLTTPQSILHGATCYARERAGQDKEFTKHPSTWLNGGCWEDYAARMLVTQGAGQNNAQAAFYAAFTSPELEAWDKYQRKATGLGCPKDKAGGWYFPTRWPPGQ